MSEQIIRRTGRIVDMQATMPWLVAAGVYVLLLVLARGCSPTPTPIRTSRSAAGFSNITQCRRSIRFRQPCAERIGSRSSGGRRLRMRQLTRSAAGSLSSLSPPRLTAAARTLTRFLLREWQPIADAGRGARRASAGRAAYSGAAACTGAADDGGMDRGTDPRGRYARAPWLAAAADDAMGEPARQLHVRPGDGRADRVRRVLACDAGET